MPRRSRRSGSIRIRTPRNIRGRAAGRIEILTKPGSQQYHGEFNTLIRNGHLSARNAFASAKPQEQRHSVEGFLGGPIGQDGKTMFMLSANDERDANQAYIHAIGPDGPIDGQLPHTSGEARLTGSITRQVSREQHVVDSAELSVRERREP